MFFKVTMVYTIRGSDLEQFSWLYLFILLQLQLRDKFIICSWIAYMSQAYVHVLLLYNIKLAGFGNLYFIEKINHWRATVLQCQDPILPM